MNAPTLDNVREIAAQRAPRRGLDVDAVVDLAMAYVAERKVNTAPAAVEWAIQRLDKRWEATR